MVQFWSRCCKFMTLEAAFRLTEKTAGKAKETFARTYYTLLLIQNSNFSIY